MRRLWKIENPETCDIAHFSIILNTDDKYPCCRDGFTILVMAKTFMFDLSSHVGIGSKEHDIGENQI